MKVKTARRWLMRNQWQIAKQYVTSHISKKNQRQLKIVTKVLNKAARNQL